MDKYIINQGDFHFIEDSLTDKQFLIKNIESVQWLPSVSTNSTLYVLSNGGYYYGGTSEFIQVIPTEQVVVSEEAITPEEEIATEKSTKK